MYYVHAAICFFLCFLFVLNGIYFLVIKLGLLVNLLFSSLIPLEAFTECRDFSVMFDYQSVAINDNNHNRLVV